MKTVVGLFETQEAAERAVNDLIAAGYTNDQIGVSLRGETRAASASSNDPLLAKTSGPEPSDQAAVSGYGVGAALGGPLGLLLAGAGAVVFPGIGLVAAAGPLLTALGGALAGAGLGAAVGGLTGGMSAQGNVSEDPDIYADVLQYGGVILTVDTEAERVQEVQTLFAQAGAVDVNARRPSQTTDPNEAAVQEADAIDRPAVAQIQASGTQQPGVSGQVQTPSANVPLASDAAVAATEPSGLASLKPGQQSAPATTTEFEQTTVNVPAHTGQTTTADAPGAPTQPVESLGHSKALFALPTDTTAPALPPHLTNDLQAEDIVLPITPPTMPSGPHDNSITASSTDTVDFAQPEQERDLTIGEAYGGAMAMPDEERPAERRTTLDENDPLRI